MTQGTAVRLAGRIWQGQAGIRTPLFFYFQRRGTTAWVPAGYVWSTDRGDFIKNVRATVSGVWKVVSRATPTRAAVTRGRIVNVYAFTARQVVAYRETAGNWQSPRIRIPTTDYRAVVSYSCPAAGFLYLTWNGDNLGYEYVRSTNASATLTLTGHQGGRFGHFDVSTSQTCTWNMKVFAGTTRVLV